MNEHKDVMQGCINDEEYYLDNGKSKTEKKNVTKIMPELNG